MPQLGESAVEATVTGWLKSLNDHVEFDEPLVEVSTDKIDTELPSPVTGFLRHISVPVDATVAVGEVLATIEEDPQAVSEGKQMAPSETQAVAAEAAPYVTPVVRALALEHGVNLAFVKGTGVYGRIRKQDVLEAAKAMGKSGQPS
jgi:pyruvate dehydrogenase E2 component (dihydrolipoamide acetyltransferase)